MSSLFKESERSRRTMLGRSKVWLYKRAFYFHKAIQCMFFACYNIAATQLNSLSCYPLSMHVTPGHYPQTLLPRSLSIKRGSEHLQQELLQWSPRGYCLSGYFVIAWRCWVLHHNGPSLLPSSKKRDSNFCNHNVEASERLWEVRSIQAINTVVSEVSKAPFSRYRREKTIGRAGWIKYRIHTARNLLRKGCQ